MNKLLLSQRIVLGLILAGIVYLAVRFVIAPTHRAARPIKLATGTWEPYVGPHLEGGGPIGRIVTKTIRLIGYEPQLVFMPWDLAQEQTSYMRAFGTFPFIRNKERESKYDFSASASILPFEYVLFFYKDHINPDSIEDVEDLANYRLGIVKGYEMWEDLAPADSYFKDVYSFDTNTEAFLALVDDSVDFVPEGRIAGLLTLQGPDVLFDANEFGFLDAGAHSSFGVTESLHLLMPQGGVAKDFLDDFDTQLAKVKKTPLYRDAKEQIRCALYPVEEVELQFTSGGLANVVEADDEAVQFAVPIGTRAVVLAWPSSFMPQSEAPADEPSHCKAKSLNGSQDEAPVDGPPRYKVKLLNGPHRGRVVYVDARAVTLTR